MYLLNEITDHCFSKYSQLLSRYPLNKKGNVFYDNMQLFLTVTELELQKEKKSNMQ